MSLEMSDGLEHRAYSFNRLAMLYFLITAKQNVIFLVTKHHRVGLVYFVSLLSCLTNITVLNSVSYAKNHALSSSLPLNNQTLTKYSKNLHMRQKSLLRSLDQLQKLDKQTLKSRKFPKIRRKLLRNIKHSLKGIYKLVTAYFQAKRPTNMNPKKYLKLRKQVWQLLDRKLDLFQISKGRFCLRAHWERLLAKSYLSLNHEQLAQHHFLRAYRCNGSSEDLNSANNIKQTTH